MIRQRKKGEWSRWRINFLIRINEQREKLRNARNRPLILILPETERVMVREMSPDLWAIRNFTLVTKNWLADESALPAHPPTPQQHQSSFFSLSNYDRSLVAEWERISPAQNHDALKVANRACKALLKNGAYEQAATIAAEMVSIRRKIIERVGETPESLRDLSVSLYKLGKLSAETEKKEEARRLFQEGLRIAETLAEALPDQVDYHNLPGYFLQRLEELPDRK